MQQLQVVMRGAEGQEGRLIIHVETNNVRIRCGSTSQNVHTNTKNSQHALRIPSSGVAVVARLGATRHLAGFVNDTSTVCDGSVSGSSGDVRGVDSSNRESDGQAQRVLHFELDGDETELLLSCIQ